MFILGRRYARGEYCNTLLLSSLTISFTFLVARRCTLRTSRNMSRRRARCEAPLILPRTCYGIPIFNFSLLLSAQGLRLHLSQQDLRFSPQYRRVKQWICFALLHILIFCFPHTLYLNSLCRTQLRTTLLPF